MHRPMERPTERGIITEAYPHYLFAVRLTGGRSVFTHLSGKLRASRLALGVGDGVVVELAPTDRTPGLIVGRDDAAGEDLGDAQRVLR